ncbi:hypothetical protein D3C83_57420 [compost metagenome]
MKSAGAVAGGRPVGAETRGLVGRIGAVLGEDRDRFAGHCERQAMDRIYKAYSDKSKTRQRHQSIGLTGFTGLRHALSKQGFV